MSLSLSLRSRPQTQRRRPDLSLPSPPSDEEKYGYLGPQRRWLLWLQALSFTAIAYSVSRFSVSDLRLLLFLVPMSLYAVTLIISLSSSSRARRVDMLDHELRVSEWAPNGHPTVDVFLPTAGEPLDILGNTYRHVAALDWPAALTVWVLDDAARPEVKALAEAHGFQYRSRPDRGRLKKAGNLSYGYEQSDGDYIAIFDADFVPRADFLHELLPYFDDPEVGIVQSPQYFDAAKGMPWLQRCAGATQELFYRWIQPGRDASRAAICVGSCAVYRRKALERSGGFAQIGHSEDVHTGVKMMKIGYHVRYVPVLVAKGLCPDTVLGFLNQQYRWCTGSMSLLADQTFHTARQITARQRACFWSGFLYYISTAVNAFVAPLPALAMLYLLPQWVFPENSIWLVGALLLWLLVIPLTFRSRWRVDVLRVQIMYSFAHAVAIFHILTGRTKEWVATGTANTKVTPLAVQITRVMRTWLILSTSLVWFGLVRGCLEYGVERFWAMIALACMAAYIQLPLIFVRTRPRKVKAPQVTTATAAAATATAAATARADAAVADLTALEAEVKAPTATTSTVDVRGAGRTEVRGTVEGRTGTGTTSRTARGPGGAAALGTPAALGTTADAPDLVVTPTAPAPSGGDLTTGSPSGPKATTPGTGTPRSGGDVPAAAAPAPRKLRSFRPDIQGLRAIAVLLVVLYHADVPGIHGGYVGVDVFFVISGFLITGQLTREVDRTGRISFVNFYAGRMRRLLPPAAFVLITTVVVTRIWDSIFQVKGVTTDALWATFSMINYHLAAKGINYQNAEGPPSPLQHMWSLSVEEQYYLLWPMIVAVVALIARKRRWPALTGVLTVLVGVSIYLSITQTVSNPPYAYFSLHTRAWELGIGALLALVATRLTALPAVVAAAASWIGVGVIVWSGLVFTNATAFPGTAALVPTLGCALVIAAGCRPTRYSSERLLSLSPMRGMGRVSYSWYLWHWPMLILVPMMFGTTFEWPVKVEVAALSLWMAVLTFFLVENPALRSRFRKPAWLGLGLGLSGISVATAVAVAATVPPLVGDGTAIKVDLSKPDTAHVQDALIKSLSIINAPATLRPTVTDAAGDTPASSKDGCHADYLQIDQGDCVYGDPTGEHTLVLYGDSHAQQWLPALDTAAKKLNWKVVAWTKAACPVADMRVFNEQLGREFTECDRYREITVSRIISLRPDIVMVSQSDTVPGKQTGDGDWADSTARTLGRFVKADVPVEYMLDTPYPGTSIPDCVAQHLHNVGACNFQRKDVYLYPGRHKAMAATLSSARIATVEPLDWFCTTGKCPAIVGEILVYRDASHMSANYARWLGQIAAPLFVPRAGTEKSTPAPSAKPGAPAASVSPAGKAKG